MIEIILISIICVYLIDLSKSIDNLIKPLIKRFLKTKANITLGPLECSLCLTFWLGLFWMIATSNITQINILTLILASYFTTTIKALLELIKSTLEWIIFKTNEFLMKN